MYFSLEGALFSCFAWLIFRSRSAPIAPSSDRASIVMFTFLSISADRTARLQNISFWDEGNQSSRINAVAITLSLHQQLGSGGQTRQQGSARMCGRFSQQFLGERTLRQLRAQLGSPVAAAPFAAQVESALAPRFCCSLLRTLPPVWAGGCSFEPRLRVHWRF